MKNGIRRQLMSFFFLGSGVLCAAMICVTVAYTFTATLIANSYESNNRIKKYKNVVLSVEADLENYMNLKSYENIDSYFQSRAEMEQSGLTLNRKPSDSEAMNCEYFVVKFAESFLSYSDMAVYDKRAGNNDKASANFSRAMEAYSLTISKIDELNQLYFEENISSYAVRRDLIQQIIFISIGFVLVVVCIVIASVYYLVSEVTSPLEEISERANQLAERNFDVPLFAYKKKDEIGSICRAFNRMIISIREYIDTIWEKAIQENELREKEMKMNQLYQDARLDALQSQINPHFLFNTLNTGAQLAMMEGSDRTCDFLEKVADFYRYNLRFTGQESDIESEIRLLESYVYIMKVRFGERFDFYTDIKSSRLDTPVPGMVLQPLVENCIKHGLSEIEKGGRINLKVYEDESKRIIISISDNGIGFPEQKRRQLLDEISENPKSVINSQEKDSGTGVGMVNVISRLRMFYKTDDVFDIQNIPSGGTEFLIRISR